MTLPAWPFLMAVSALVTLAGVFLRDKPARVVGFVSLAAYALVFLKKKAFDPPFDLSISALIWVSAGVLVLSFSRIDYGKSRIYRRAGTLLILAGLCYFWARLTNAPREFGSPPFATSDLLAVCAMLIGGKRAFLIIICRIRGLGHRGWISSRNGAKLAHLSNRSQKKEKQGMTL